MGYRPWASSLAEVAGAGVDKRLGELLLDDGKLNQEQLSRALRLQNNTNERLGRVLTQLGLVAERDVARKLSEQLGLPYIEPSRFPDQPVVDESVSYKFLLDSLVLPLAIEADRLSVAMAFPQEEFVVEALRMACNRELVIGISAPGDIEQALNRIYLNEVRDDTERSSEAEPDVNDVAQLRGIASEAPVVRHVNNMISKALESGASDIHIEPFPDKLVVRYRIDGVLRDVDAPAATMTAAIVSRVKIMSNLDIAERRLPQDGRINLQIEGRLIDMRISTVPTAHGESVVMRILDQQAIPLDFTALGFSEDLLSRFRALLDLSHGIILVTGPTGSGKTTTLYTALEHLNSRESKILTVEDPVEYQLNGINQIHVKPAIGLTFASALRAILRQDPDILMIGEMRDLETAKIAVQSALTGHKVFSTLHTNNAASSVTRLLNMGIDDYLVTSTLNGVLSQRLVRKLCPACKESYEPLPEYLHEARIEQIAGHKVTKLFRSKGCPQCDNTGYHGRTSVLELMEINDETRKAILQGEDANALQGIAGNCGMQTMYEDGVIKAVSGITSMEEVIRVTQDV